MKFGAGQSTRRSEDQRFVTGTGRYTDDISLPGQAWAAFVRSPQAHARIARIGLAAAQAAPRVLGVFTIADLDGSGVQGLPCKFVTHNRDGSAMALPPYPALARGRVRYVGEPVACVVAETLAAARDAAELVEVDYASLPAVVDPMQALAGGAPQVHDEAPGNLVLDWDKGDAAATERQFAGAAHVTTVDLVNNRVIANPMEPRAALADFDAESGRYTLYTGTQGSFGLRNILAEDVLRIGPERLRVVTPDVGGGFGMKIFVFPEYVVVTWAAARLGRPVKWVADRSEALLADTHGRDHVTRAQLAVDGEGRILALRADTVANMGAYLSQFGPLIPTVPGAEMYAGVYTMRAAHFRVRCALTNTAPVDAYRGAGRPEATYVVERLVDAAARELGQDPAEFRRRNFIPSEAMPYRTAMGYVYDSGEFAQNLDQALAMADYDGLEVRRRAARARGKLRGLGISYYLERCGGGADETARIEILPQGRVRVLIGSQNNGQGHETAYAQLAAEALGVPFEAVDVVQGDTDVVPWGHGTGGSRALAVGGAATREAAAAAVEQGRALAADALEAAAADLEFEGGRYVIKGTDRWVGLFDVAARAGDGGLSADGTFKPEVPTFPNGAHLCEVEIDEPTGEVQVVGYTVVDDFGRLLNPMLVAGQVHGGVAQGIGQALMEEAVYDPNSGQLLTGSFMDYAMPHAGQFPELRVTFNEVPCRTNPLGVKGAGEAGAIAAPPAVINAVIDALSPYGITRIDMPATPFKIWRLMREKGGFA